MRDTADESSRRGGAVETANPAAQRMPGAPRRSSVALIYACVEPLLGARYRGCAPALTRHSKLKRLMNKLRDFTSAVFGGKESHPA